MKMLVTTTIISHITIIINSINKIIIFNIKIKINKKIIVIIKINKYNKIYNLSYNKANK